MRTYFIELRRSALPVHSTTRLFQEQQNGTRGELAFPLYPRQGKQTTHTYSHPMKGRKCERVGKENDESNGKNRIKTDREKTDKSKIR